MPDNEYLYHNTTNINSSMVTGSLRVDTALKVYSEFLQGIVSSDSQRIVYDVTVINSSVGEYSRSMSVTGDTSNVPVINFREDLQRKLNPLIGQKIGQYTINTQGEILAETIAAAALAITQIDLAAWGRMLVISLPETGFIADKTWKEKHEFNLPLGGNMEPLLVDLHYQFVGLKIIDDYECLKIKATMNIEEKVSLDGDEQGFIEVMHLGLSHLYFEPINGILLRSVTSQNLSVDIYEGLTEESPRVINSLKITMDNITNYIGN